MARDADRGDGATQPGDGRRSANAGSGRAGSRFGPPRSPEQRDIIGELRKANLILNHLPQSLFDQLVDHLIPVSLVPDAVLVEPQKQVDRVYFPLDGLISIVSYLPDGGAAEVALGDRDGFAGLSVALGGQVEETETIVLLEAKALVIRADTLREVMTAYPEIRAILIKFNAMMMAQMCISVACMARHNLEQRLARWLLTATLRAGQAALEIRQESLALILGVRRTGVSEALARLVADGVVYTGRGKVVIRDRTRLEARSCNCFREVEAARRRVAPDIVITHPIPSARLHELVDRFGA